MSTPIDVDRLDALTCEGIAPHQIIEELVWLQFKGIELANAEGRAKYLRLSRAGRNFAMNRRTRRLLCDYAERLACVIVTNTEADRLGYAPVNLEASV